MNYIPNTKKEQELMLKNIGLNSFEELFTANEIPENVILKHGLDIPNGLSEIELADKFEIIAAKNKVYKTIFRGAGAYNHYIPSTVRHIVSRSEFVTAYTPYQAEISQGILQAIFEYQTMICMLTGMDVSNASVYDGGTAAAEAINMCRDKKLDTVLVSSTIKPHILQVITTYCNALGIKVAIIPEKDGVTDIAVLENLLTSGDTADRIAAVYTEQINYFGIIEDCKKIADLVHTKRPKAKYIVGTYPVALGILKSPAEFGADIVTGEGQPLGLPMAFGGPYLGYIAAKKELMRKLPGRIVGETTDKNGHRAFVLTLQAREQHIRREKAASSICSNQALCALTASVYLASLGPQGLKEAATLCNSKARYMADKLTGTGKVLLKHNSVFFNEFVTTSKINSQKILQALEENNILGGIALNDSDILWCVTEVNKKSEIDKVAELIVNLNIE